MSSTTLASRNIGVPLPRSSTKSSIVEWSKTTSPRTRSCTVVVSVGHSEAQHPSWRRAEATITGVTVVPAGSRCLGSLLDLLGREVAVVGRAGLEQPLGGGDVRSA